jgi:Flp pilus assembly protein TadG
MSRSTDPVRRARARGAAMIEAVIVLSTMLVFLGLIMWTRNSYGMKLDMQQSTRSSSLYYAAHGCKGDRGAASSDEGGTVLDSSDEASNVAKKAKIPAAAAASRVYNTARAKLSGKSSFMAVWDASGGKGLDLKKQALSRTVTAESKVTCNELSFGGGWQDWLSVGLGFITGNLSGAGGFFK